MCSSTPINFEDLRATGQVASLEYLEKLVVEFEQVLKSLGILIKNGSELEKACLSVIALLSKNQDENVRNHREDIREIYTEVLGIWLFLQKIVRHQKHPSFAQFVPHLALLNDGTVIQNTRSRVCDEAANKIFELLFALVLLDLSDDVVLDPPDGAVGDNPDILAWIDGVRWGFACKTLHASSGKTFFGNLQKGVEQIQVSPAEVGCVVTNVRNLLDPDVFWPILNKADYLGGAAPIFAAYRDVREFVAPKIATFVLEKRNQIVSELTDDSELESNPIEDLFSGKKALPMFFAFFQTVSGAATKGGPVASSIITLSVGTFGDVSAHQVLFERINRALHERGPLGQRIIATRAGGPDVLRLETFEPGAPGPGEILLGNQAVGVAFADVLIREGLYWEIRSAA